MSSGAGGIDSISNRERERERRVMAARGAVQQPRINMLAPRDLLAFQLRRSITRRAALGITVPLPPRALRTR